MDIATLLTVANTLTAFLTSPLATMLGGSLLALGFSLLLRQQPETRPAAEAVADYLEAVELAVIKAESSGLIGANKLKLALDEVEAFLAKQGIQGDAKTVTLDRVRADVELVKARLFPKGA